MSKSNNSFSFFGFIFGGLAFFGVWIFSIVAFNFLGLVLGWIPAMVVAGVVYLIADIAMLLLFMLIALIVMVAGVSFMLW